MTEVLHGSVEINGRKYEVTSLAVGWECPDCICWNGDEKEPVTTCRHCGEDSRRSVSRVSDTVPAPTICDAEDTLAGLDLP